MIGVDLLKIDRIEDMMKRFGDKALKRFLDDEEIELSKNKLETIAGFYAAKEAVSKALGCGISKECGFKDIKIYKDEKNKPYFKLSKRVIENFGITYTDLSISHDAGFVIATAQIESKNRSKISPF